MKSSVFIISRALLAVAPLVGFAHAAFASIIDANSAANTHACRSREREPFLRCSTAIVPEPTPVQNDIEFFHDGCGDSITVQVSSATQDPITYPGKIAYIGDVRMDYSFAPQSPDGDFLYSVSTFFEGPDGWARGSLRGSGVDALPLVCRYQ